MANLVTTHKTSLQGEDVIVRAVQYFTNEKWRAQSQSARVATFQGRPSIPWFLLFLTVIAFICLVVPGIVMYFLIIRRVYRFVNLVVTANPLQSGSEVVINYPKHARRLVNRFTESLPPLLASTQA